MTYGDIHELSTPCDEIHFSGDMRIGQCLHVVKERCFGFEEVCSHVEERLEVMGVAG
jgi:hypothetical protein